MKNFKPLKQTQMYKFLKYFAQKEQRRKKKIVFKNIFLPVLRNGVILAVPQWIGKVPK